MTRVRTSTLGTVAFVLCMLTASCAPAMRVYVNPEADLAFYKKIAVLPFVDLTSGQAAPQVTRAFVTELIITNRYDIVQPEDFTSSLHRMGILRQQDGTYDSEKLKSAATQLGLSGIVRGSVSEHQMTHGQGGDIPSVAFDAELVDVATGNIVWRSSITRRGKGRLSIIGNGTRSLARVTQDACTELVARLKAKALK